MNNNHYACEETAHNPLSFNLFVDYAASGESRGRSMYSAIATLAAGMMVAGSIVWASQEQANAVRCAAYVGSEAGALSIAAIVQRKDNNATRIGYAALVYAGCPFPYPDQFHSTALLREFGS